MKKTVLAVACAAVSAMLANAATYTVYVCDTEGWGAEKCRLHIWHENPPADYLPWAENAYVSDTETSVEYNGAQVPVYSYTFDWDIEPTHIMVRWEQEHISKEFPFVNGGYYTITESDIFAEPQTYTVNFIDTEGWGAENTLVHVWQEGGPDYLAWDLNEPMTPVEGKYATAPDGRDGRVHTYTFSWNKKPTNIKFHQKGGSAASPDYEFTDEGWYSPTHQNIADVGIKPVEMRRYTVYFADGDGWGAEHTQVMVVDQGGNPLHEYTQDDHMTDTGKIYYGGGDDYRSVYSYTFEMEYPTRPVTVRFHVGENTIKRTDDLAFGDNMLYFNDGHNLSSWEYTDISGITTTLYFCSTQYTFNGDDRMKPHCHVFLNDGSDAETKAYTPMNSIKEEMRQIGENMWAFDVVGIERFNDVKFYFLPDGLETAYYYTASRAANPNSAGYFDSVNWTKWIYTSGKGGGATQTYMTIDDYYGIQDSDNLTHVYITGNKAAGFDPEWEPNAGVKVEADAGVFFYKIHTQAETGAGIEQPRYKITTVIVPEAMGSEPYNNQRAWATFNLGLVGCADDSKAVPGFQGADNSVVFFDLNVPMPYNSINAYDWTVSTDSEHVSVEPDHDYWMVIDTHSACRSLTLLEFDPNPSVSIEDITVTPVEIGYERAMAMHDGDMLDAAGANGAIYFDHVNVATGTASFTTQDIDYLTREKLEPEYTVYMNSQPVAIHEGAAESLVIDYLPVGADIPVAVRAKYRSTQSGLQFHSRTGQGSVSGAAIDLPQPITSVRSANLIANDDASTGSSTIFDAIAEFDYDVESGLVSYPDFSFTLNGSDHDAIIDTDTMPFERYSGEGDYTDSFNWSKTVNAGNILPVRLCNAVEVDDPENGSYETMLEGSIHAVFPFMVAINPEPSTLPSSKKARRTAPAVPEDLTGYRIATGRTTAIHPVTLDRQDITTGLTGIATDAVGPVTYYNLQGVRIDNPASGTIVIRRQGDKAEKIVVR